MVWDIMGQQGYRSLLQQSYFAGASGAIAVCDSTRPETLGSLQDWIDGIRGVCGNIPVVVLANKADLKDMMQLDASDLQALTQKNNASGYFTSAKTGANVEKSFMDLVKATLAAGE